MAATHTTRDMDGVPVLDIKPGDALPADRVMRAVKVTPALASDWLTRFSDPKRRNTRPVHVDSLADDMADGLWIPLKGPIEFTNGGVTPILAEGNHRMKAIVQSGVSLWLLVWFNAEPGTRLVEGHRIQRSAADTLRMEGLYANVHGTTAIVRQHWLYTLTVGEAIRWTRTTANAKLRPDTDDVAKHWQADTGLFDTAVRAVQNVRHNVPNGLPPKALGTFVAEAERLHPGEGVTFLKDVMSGGGPTAKGKTIHVVFINFIRKGPLDIDRLIVETLIRGFNAELAGHGTFIAPLINPSRPFTLSAIAP